MVRIISAIFTTTFVLYFSLLPAQNSGEYYPENTVSGDWFGLRTGLRENGIDLQTTYTGNVFSNLNGGVRQGNEYLDVFDISFSANLDSLFGWRNAVFFTDVIGLHGGDPGDLTGDAQGISNIAAENSWKIYEVWLQQRLWNEKLTVLAGIHDLNCHCDVIETAGLFLNGSHGMGPEFSQSGKNGPSTFPVTALGLGMEFRPASKWAFRMQIMDGVPGAVENPQQIDLHFSRREGALFTLELKRYLKQDIYREKVEKISRKNFAGKRREKKRGKFGRGRRFPNRTRQQWYGMMLSGREAEFNGKLAVGGWIYSADFSRLMPDGGNESLIPEEKNWGIYALLDIPLFTNTPHPGKEISWFARAGFANPDVNRFDSYLGSGLVFSGILPGRDTDFLGIACAAVHNGQPYRDKMAAAGSRTDGWEINLELTWRIEMFPWLLVQPDCQYVINPGTNPAVKNSLVVGTCIEVNI